MYALTVRQPWASLIAAGIKDVENRSWPPPRVLLPEDPEDERPLFAIHAAKRFEDTARLPEELPAWLAYPTGCIVAVARVAGIVTPDGLLMRTQGEVGFYRDSPWFDGTLAWALEDVRALSRPVPCSGKQGLWAVPEPIVRVVRARTR